MNALDENPWFAHVPNLLCQWHVNMNVVAKTKKFFPPGTKRTHFVERHHPTFKAFLQHWKTLIASSDIDSFDRNLRSFQQLHRYPAPAVHYAVNMWILPWKEKLVAYWVNQVQHFGHRTTSAVE